MDDQACESMWSDLSQEAGTLKNHSAPSSLRGRADCKWDVRVLAVCLGLRHTLKSGWFDLRRGRSGIAPVTHVPVCASTTPITRSATDCPGGGWAKVSLCLSFRDGRSIFLVYQTEISRCHRRNLFHTAISWQLIRCRQHNRGNLTLIRQYHIHEIM